MEKTDIYVVYEDKDLSSVGCGFFIEAEHKKTLLTSTELRWLTVKENRESPELFTEKQVEANNCISKCANRDWGKLDMKVLLYKNPKNLVDNNHIVQLIRAGADVRFLKMNNITKICLSENKLFLSFAPNIEQVANKGILYNGRQNEDPIIGYYESIFNNDFIRARRIIVKNNKLSYEDKWYQFLYKTIKEISLKELIIMFIGAILGIFITVLVKILIT